MKIRKGKCMTASAHKDRQIERKDEEGRMGRDVHDDEDGADDDALDAATEDRVGDDGERLVDDHVCKK